MMEEHYFYLPEIRPKDKSVTITGEEFHHLDKVLRLRKGKDVFLLNGKGYVFRGEILIKNRNSAYVEIKDFSFLKKPKPKIILLPALLKQDRMELLFEKAIELGVSEIVPVIAKNCVVKIKDSQIKKSKFNRWEKILIQAMKQCSNPWLPQLYSPMMYKEVLKKYTQDSFTKFILTKDGQDISTLSRLSLDSQGVALLVGPEGDFTLEELRQAVEAGFKPLSLGDIRLRSETAGIVAITLVKYLTREFIYY